MVFIESKKYACETCIKGHRSSACKHTDRPLFEIKKKGRPVTQCEHCRELRKTKQVHVKCICEIKPDSGPRKVGTKAPDSAAFPNGLPQALAMEASVAHIEQHRSPSGPTRQCCCSNSDNCHCWTARKSALPRPRRKTESALSASVRPLPASAPSVNVTIAQEQDPAPPAASHIIARISELRPVLPRPSTHHEPSSGMAHGYPNRHHHENAFFSPYGRAYDINHPHHIPHTADPSDAQNRLTPAIANSIPAPSPPNAHAASAATNITFPSPCGCGDGCTCPGCFHHNNAPLSPSLTAYPTCQNPSSCHACLDSTILSLPPDTALSIPQAEVIDDWIRQMSTINNMTNGWDNPAQLTTAARRQCPTCASFYCTCDKEASPDRTAEANGDKSRASSADLGSMMVTSPTSTQAQGGEYDGSTNGFFEYAMLGMQPSTTTNDGFLPDTNTPAGGIDAFRSRSPSISPHHDSFSTSPLFAAFPYSSALVDKMAAPQQSMYINGRGFYSDPYLSLSSTHNDQNGFGMIQDGGSPYMHALQPPPAPLSPLTSNAPEYLNQQTNGTTATSSYAVSNPDSDTSSSFDSSIDDHFAPPPPAAPSSLSSHQLQSHNSKHHSLSISPVSFEDVRTLY